jgi:outer membrane protein assembly factor BamB
MRRIVLAVALALAVLAAALHREGGGPLRTRPVTTLAPPPAPRAPVDWPAYGFDPARTHAAPFDLAPPFRELWREHADWSLIEFPPTVVNGRLFVGTNHGLLLALDAATGRTLWRRRLGRCIASSPAVAGGLVVVGVMAPPPACDRDVPSFVAAFDAATGHPVWRVVTGPVETPPLAAGGGVLVGSWRGDVFDLGLRNGAVRWSFETSGPIKAGAARRGRLVIAASYDGRVYALDAASGRLRWSTAVGAPVYATPSLSRGLAVVAAVDGTVHALSLRTGAIRWSRQIGRFVYSPAAIARGRAYVGSYDHHLYALDLRSGSVLWRAAAPGPVSGAPTVLGHLVFFSSCGSCSRFESNPQGRRTFAVDAADGHRVWSFPDGEYSPVVSDGLRIYLTGYTTLYALRPRLP